MTHHEMRRNPGLPAIRELNNPPRDSTIRYTQRFTAGDIRRRGPGSKSTASTLTTIGDRFKSAAQAELDDTVFKHGKAVDSPVIPDEVLRNPYLPPPPQLYSPPSDSIGDRKVASDIPTTKSGNNTARRYPDVSALRKVFGISTESKKRKSQMMVESEESLSATYIPYGREDGGLQAEDEGIPGHNPGHHVTTRHDPEATASRISLQLGSDPYPQEQDLRDDVRAELQDIDTRNPQMPRQSSLVDEFEQRIEEEFERPPGLRKVPFLDPQIRLGQYTFPDPNDPNQNGRPFHEQPDKQSEDIVLGPPKMSFTSASRPTNVFRPPRDESVAKLMFPKEDENGTTYRVGQVLSRPPPPRPHASHALQDYQEQLDKYRATSPTPSGMPANMDSQQIVGLQGGMTEKELLPEEQKILQHLRQQQPQRSSALRRKDAVNRPWRKHDNQGREDKLQPRTCRPRPCFKYTISKDDTLGHVARQRAQFAALNNSRRISNLTGPASPFSKSPHIRKREISHQPVPEPKASDFDIAGGYESVTSVSDDVMLTHELAFAQTTTYVGDVGYSNLYTKM